MSMTKVKKQGWEAYYISGSILKWQLDGSTEVVVLADSTVVAEDEDGNDVSDTFMDQVTKRLDDDLDGDFTDNMLSMRFKSEGGDEDSEPYYVTFKMVTNEGNKYESEFKVEVKEVP